MATEIEMHPVQIRILRTLLFKKEARFSDLNSKGLTNDHFTFHINQLVDLEIVKKTREGKYRLTSKGKEFANRLDVEKEEIERQAKIGVLLVCVKRTKGIKKYLVQQRLKQPYFGFHGFPTGKVTWGETVEETAARELKEETGLHARPILAGVKHKMDYAKKDGTLLEDKYFFVFRCENIRGKLIEMFEGGKNMWLTRKEIKGLPNQFDAVDETIDLANQKKLLFSENKYKVSGY